MPRVFKALIRAILGFTFVTAFFYTCWPVIGPTLVRPLSSRPYGMTDLVASAVMCVFVVICALGACQMGGSLLGRKASAGENHRKPV